MNINLSLNRHCIETEIKKLYNRDISSYFKADNPAEKNEMEERIDQLHHALETLDFGYLRNRYNELRGGSDASVVLFIDRERAIHIQINGDEIDAKNSI